MTDASRCPVFSWRFSRRCAGECDSRSSSECRRIFLRSPLDELASRSKSRHTRLVYRHWRRCRAGRARHSWQLVPRRENQWRIPTTRRDLAQRVWILLLILTILSLTATMLVRPAVLQSYFHYPIAFLIPAGVLASLFGILLYSRKERDFPAFLSSCFYLSFMLAGAAAGLSRLLPSSRSALQDITISNSLAGHHGLAVGLVWWALGSCWPLDISSSSIECFAEKLPTPRRRMANKNDMNPTQMKWLSIFCSPHLPSELSSNICVPPTERFP